MQDNGTHKVLILRCLKICPFILWHRISTLQRQSFK